MKLMEKRCSECGNPIHIKKIANRKTLISDDGVCFASIFGWQCNKCFKKIWDHVKQDE